MFKVRSKRTTWGDEGLLCNKTFTDYVLDKRCLFDPRTDLLPLRVRAQILSWVKQNS
jgi:hypothetical protein